MSLRIAVQDERCTGCRACMLMCSLRRVGEIRLSASAIRIVSRPDEGAFLPMVCLACLERPCVAACPVGAIEDRDGFPFLDPQLCVGCRACERVCPFDAIGFDPVTGTAVKCDLCGGDPLCVRTCNAAGTMPGALSVVDAPPKPPEVEVARRRAETARRWERGGVDG